MQRLNEMTCPNEMTLRQFLHDELADIDIDRVKEHIDACAECQTALERFIGSLPPLDEIALHDPSFAARMPFTASPDVPGYELLGELGRGGMGVVYKARQLRPNRTVALKMLLAGGNAGPKERARFLREAEAVAQLQHPNIVPLYESGQHGVLLYLTLEYVSGGSLADLLQGTPLPALAAARLVEQLSRGIHHAHQCGVIHRDLKPANVLIQLESPQSGRSTAEQLQAATPKITDFGLAKILAESEGLTATNAVCGTPSYMAPEQAIGKASGVGTAADVYALGTILYECLTGRAPFHGPTPTDTLLQVVGDEPVAPSRLQPNLPRDLETICLKCLRKAPNQRYPSALELAEDLRRYQAGEPIQARPASACERVVKWCRRRPAVAILLAAVVLVTLSAGSLVTWQWRRTAAALDELQSEKRARAQRQIAALTDAAPSRVPAILEELAANREEILPLLRDRHEQEKDPARRMRLALALLPIESETLREPLTDWMLQADEPAEVLLVRDALLPFRAELIPQLWAKAEDERTQAAVRFRAWAALAAYDPHHARWRTVGPQVSEQILWANPLHRNAWTDAFRPVASVLHGPMTEASYYPLKLGTKWHYQRETSLGDKTSHLHHIVKIEKIDGQSLARLEAIRSGELVGAEHLSTTAQGIFRHRNNGWEISPPLCLLRFPIKVGDSWTSEHRFGEEKGIFTCRIGHEEIVVPAGKYQAITSHVEVTEASGKKVNVVYWFAPGVGIVKQSVVLPPPPSPAPPIVVASNTLGLLTSPFGDGPLLAVSTLCPGSPTTLSLSLERFEEP